MKTTIDKAGRLVIPAAVRARMGLKAGTPLQIDTDDEGIRLRPLVPRPKLVRVRGRLVARPTAAKAERPVIDVAALVAAERDRWPF